MLRSRAARSLYCAHLVLLIDMSVAVGPLTSTPCEGLMLSESGCLRLAAVRRRPDDRSERNVRSDRHVAQVELAAEGRPVMPSEVR